MSKKVKKKQPKPQKEKVVYYDDNSTIADMSAVGRRRPKTESSRPRATFKEQWKTYWSAVRMMLIPCAIALLILGLLYLLLMLMLN